MLKNTGPFLKIALLLKFFTTRLLIIFLFLINYMYLSDPQQIIMLPIYLYLSNLSRIYSFSKHKKDAFFSDSSKIFDSVNHRLLLWKSYNMGVRNNVLCGWNIFLMAELLEWKWKILFKLAFWYSFSNTPGFPTWCSLLFS